MSYMNRIWYYVFRWYAVAIKLIARRHMCLNDPINTYLRGNRKRGTVSKDRWGTTISFPTDAPGPMPVTTDGLAVCSDITRWRETVHAPDIAACTDPWWHTMQPSL